MRLISQGGRTDINYEKCVLRISEVIVEAICDGAKYFLAEYSTPQKLDTVISRLHDRYKLCSGKGIFYFPKDSEV
jgi:hypothetical protein